MRSRFILPLQSASRASLEFVPRADCEARAFIALIRFMREGRPLPEGFETGAAVWSKAQSSYYQYVPAQTAGSVVSAPGFNIPRSVGAIEVDLQPWGGERRDPRTVFEAVLLRQPVPEHLQLPHASITIRSE